VSELKRDQLLMAVISGRGPAYLRGVDLSDVNLSGAMWLIEADLRQANLSNAIFNRANLKGANLERATLHACDLSGANLEGANLRGVTANLANLRRANLRGADLQDARLVGANFTKADLENAILDGADLEGADLRGANLWNAKLDLANLKMVNLSGASIRASSFQGAVAEEVHDVAEVESVVHGFSGVVDYVQLTDLIQLVCLSRSNVLVRVTSPHGRGTIHMRAGKVRHAEAGDLEGEEAFCRMLQWDNGHFETAPLLDADISTIDKPLEHLIIESMRYRDETASGGSAEE